MKFITGLCFLAILFIHTSCKQQSSFGKKLTDSDSLVIQFTDSISGNVIKSMQATDPKAIEKLSRFVDAKQAEVYKCGYNGTMKFYKKGTLNGDVSFHYSNPDCRHFLYSEADQLVSTKMSNEAADFLKGMAEGRTTY